MPIGNDSIIGEIERKIRTQEVLEEEDFATLIIQSTIDGIYAYDRDLVITLWNPAMERISGLKKSQAIGRNVFEAGPHLVNYKHLILDPLQGKVVEEAEVPFEIKETGRRGFVRRLSCPLVSDSGQVVGGLCIVHEITKQKHAESEALTRRRAEERLKFLSEAGMVLSGTLEYQKVLNLVLQLASRQFDAWTKLRLLDSDGKVNVVIGHHDAVLGEKLAEIERSYPPTEDLKEGPLWVLRNGGQQFYPRITEEMIRGFARDERHLELLRSMKSYICVPLVAGGRVFGTFSLLGTSREFTEEDLSLSHDLARWIALAIGNAQLFARKAERPEG